MGELFVNIGIVLLLILVEGVFVAAEIALVSLREGQVRALQESGRRGGAAVSRLVGDPNRFLAAVQIGVTSTALLSSAFGAVTISDEVSDFLVDHGWSDGLASVVGVVGVTLVISFVTLVVGELAPKRLGLQRAEGAALFFAPPLERIAAVFRPIIWLLSRATNGIVRALGGDPEAGRAPITDEELRGLVAAHESLGSDERTLIDDVFAAGERSVDEVMVPRTEVTFLEGTMTVARAAKVASDSPHSRYPVVGRGHDDVVGFIHIRDLLVPSVRHERDRTVASLVREVKALPGSKHVLAAMSEMRREGHHLAIVVDEYGGTDGIVTLEDLIEEVIGDIRDEYDTDADDSSRLASGELEVNGLLNLDEVAELVDVELPEGPYSTLGGYVMAALGRLPQTGDAVDYEGLQLTVLRVEGRRAARIRLSPRPDAAAAPVAAEAG
ncbi:putative hemolysin [Jatrophihabitans endophyticus]|uniref:Putative hemolysin n=1 Tax=Jatrophihabitans endophyticus TaxID=1206085 RepID=A0A1M5GBS3_9ACTN|nr:hemolysin family protein [Jatrophihabitans endophyticus]SHG01164.1 putative hemolysin [Jatrophihabitans endophyticus]